MSKFNKLFEEIMNEANDCDWEGEPCTYEQHPTHKDFLQIIGELLGGREYGINGGWENKKNTVEFWDVRTKKGEPMILTFKADVKGNNISIPVKLVGDKSDKDDMTDLGTLLNKTYKFNIKDKTNKIAKTIGKEVKEILKKY